MLRQRIPTLRLVLLGLLVPTTAGRADEAAAVKVIKARGGSVKVDDQRPGLPVVSVVLNDSKVTDVSLKELKKLKGLQSLNLPFTKVTDAGLKELKELTSLQSLTLMRTQVTDAGLAELKELKSLQSLTLSFTKVTDAGVAELRVALAC